MGIEVELRDTLEGAFGMDAAEAIDAMMDRGPELARSLPRFEDFHFPYLRLIDPYGYTIFNSLQMDAVIPELQLLAAQDSSASVQRVLELARRAGADKPRFLVFIGD